LNIRPALLCTRSMVPHKTKRANIALARMQSFEGGRQRTHMALRRLYAASRRLWMLQEPLQLGLRTQT
jgi:ABC-type transport system involved in cytochrome c biogenesis ATPase subunit